METSCCSRLLTTERPRFRRSIESSHPIPRCPPCSSPSGMECCSFAERAERACSGAFLQANIMFAIRPLYLRAVRRQLDLFFLVKDGEAAAAFQSIQRRLLAHIDFKRLALIAEVKPNAMQHVGQRGPKAEEPAVIPQSCKTIDKNHPHARSEEHT